MAMQRLASIQASNYSAELPYIQGWIQAPLIDIITICLFSLKRAFFIFIPKLKFVSFFLKTFFSTYSTFHV